VRGGLLPSADKTIHKFGNRLAAQASGTNHRIADQALFARYDVAAPVKCQLQIFLGVLHVSFFRCAARIARTSIRHQIAIGPVLKHGFCKVDIQEKHLP
jgi:hypothetical protein